MTRLGVTAAASLLVVAVAGCGIGGDGDLQQIGSEDLAGLDQTTTTTSTTTTTTVPPGTEMGTSTSALTTTTIITTEPVELYFLAGTVIESITQEFSRGVSLTRVLQALESEPRGEATLGLTSAVPEGLTRPVIEPRTGVATVDLDGEVFDTIEGGLDQRLAIAQIVLTLTRRPGVGQVRFTLDGEDLSVPKLGNVLSEPGEPVSRLDYESLLNQVDVMPTVPPTTTGESTPSSSEPSSSGPT